MKSWITNKDFSTSVWTSAVSWFLFQFIIPPVVEKYYSKKTSHNKLNENDKIQWCSRVVSTIHAVICTVAGLYVLFTDKPSYEDALWGKSVLGEMTGAFTWGYMIADFLYMLVILSPQTVDAYYGSLVHHFCFIAVYPFIMSTGAMTHLLLIRLIAEMSTPFVNMRWHLAVTGRKTSKQYFYNGLLLLFTFFISRVLLMSYCYWRFYEASNTPGYYKLESIKWIFAGPIIVDCLNLFWFYKLVLGSIKHLFSPNKDD